MDNRVILGITEDPKEKEPFVAQEDTFFSISTSWLNFRRTARRKQSSDIACFGRMSGLPRLDLSKVETSGRKPRENGFVGSLTSASARTAEPPRDTLMSSNSYLATARELVFTYKERNGPGMGGLGETKQRHRLRGFHTEDMGLKRVDFKADKALLALPAFLLNHFSFHLLMLRLR